MAGKRIKGIKFASNNGLKVKRKRKTKRTSMPIPEGLTKEEAKEWIKLYNNFS